GDVEHHRAGEALLTGEVRLERDAVHDGAAEPELLRARPVAAVGRDDDAGVELARVDRRALAHFGSGAGRLLEQEVVEPPALRHVRERRTRAALEARAEVEAALEALDHVFDHRVDREREQPRGAQCHAAAAGLVAGEPRLVHYEYTRARAREAVRARRAGWSGADDGDVVGGHAVRLQSSAPGVCPSGQRERAVNPSAQPTEVRILPPPFTFLGCAPLRWAPPALLAQLVEHLHGKEGVDGSSPSEGSYESPATRGVSFFFRATRFGAGR